MRVAAAGSQARALARVSLAAARRHGAGPLSCARRARRLRLRGGFEYDEALAAGLLDPGLPERRALRHVSEHETTALVDRLNPEELAGTTAEKIIFYRHFAALGLPVPALYGVVGRAGGWSAATGRPVAGAPDTARFLADEPPGELVVKPSGGHHGVGVRVLRRDGAALVDLEGRRLTPLALAAELLADREFDLYVVQERLRNHEELQRICASEALETVRVTTFVDADGEAQVLHACLKLALGGRNVDNFHGGATGNALAEVDVGSGMLRRPVGAPPAVADAVEGARVPLWDEALDLARRCAVALMPQRTMGLDLAVTPRGVLAVEANRGYDPFPSEAFGDVVRGIRAALERSSRRPLESVR